MRTVIQLGELRVVWRPTKPGRLESIGNEAGVSDCPVSYQRRRFVQPVIVALYCIVLVSVWAHISTLYSFSHRDDPPLVPLPTTFHFTLISSPVPPPFRALRISTSQ